MQAEDTAEFSFNYPPCCLVRWVLPLLLISNPRASYIDGSNQLLTGTRKLRAIGNSVSNMMTFVGDVALVEREIHNVYYVQ